MESAVVGGDLDHRSNFASQSFLKDIEPHWSNRPAQVDWLDRRGCRFHQRWGGGGLQRHDGSGKEERGVRPETLYQSQSNCHAIVHTDRYGHRDCVLAVKKSVLSGQLIGITFLLTEKDTYSCQHSAEGE